MPWSIITARAGPPPSGSKRGGYASTRPPAAVRTSCVAVGSGGGALDAGVVGDSEAAGAAGARAAGIRAPEAGSAAAVAASRRARPRVKIEISAHTTAIARRRPRGASFHRGMELSRTAQGAPR